MQTFSALPAALDGDLDAVQAFIEPFEALIFDMDGTLLDTMPLHEIAWRETLSHAGLPIEPPVMRALMGVPAAQSLTHIGQRAGRAFDLAEALTFKAERVEALFSAGIEETPFADLARLTASLRPQGVGTGSLRGEAQAWLQSAGLEDYFGALVGADEVTHHKPHPETFVEVAHRLGVDPAKCCVFEDGDPGIQAALNAGMAAVDIRLLWRSPRGYFDA